jgi:hypothetical protein
MPLTGKLARIDDELCRASDGDCWHGPPLRAGLSGVTAKAAAARHPRLVPSAWALVNHLSAWVEVVERRIAEWRAIESPDADDFPPVPSPQTNAPTRPPHCSRISGPVVSSWTRGSAGWANWSVRNQPFSAASRRAAFWKFSGEDGGAFGTTTTSAPTGARAVRSSADIFSGITQTSR